MAERLTRREVTTCIVQGVAEVIVCLLQAGMSEEAEELVEAVDEIFGVDVSHLLPEE